jgi:emp24/gp25L/p24 family/GOLD
MVIQYNSSPKLTAHSLYRSKILQTSSKRTRSRCHLATTPSMQSKTENTHTASVMSTGRQAARRYRSTCMELSMYRSRMRPRILWRKKVGENPPRLELIIDIWSPVKSLSELLSQVKDEQAYIVVRERTHRNTAESTNARVKWWSVFQLGVLVGMCIFQVWWLKRFFEVSCRLRSMPRELVTDDYFVQVKRVV